MAPEPLKSAITCPVVEDTSLALPSDKGLRSGQQRVLDQVHTIKRSKSKQGKNGALTPSPTSTASLLLPHKVEPDMLYPCCPLGHPHTSLLGFLCVEF